MKKVKKGKIEPKVGEALLFEEFDMDWFGKEENSDKKRRDNDGLGFEFGLEIIFKSTGKDHSGIAYGIENNIKFLLKELEKQQVEDKSVLIWPIPKKTTT